MEGTSNPVSERRRGEGRACAHYGDVGAISRLISDGDEQTGLMQSVISTWAEQARLLRSLAEDFSVTCQVAHYMSRVYKHGCVALSLLVRLLTST